MIDNTKKDPHFAKKFIESRLIQIAKEAAEAGIPPDLFEALVISLTDDLDFQDIVNQ